MAPPKGNKFWLRRSTHGRNPTFETAEDLRDACYQYFDYVDDNPLQEAIVYQGELNEDQSKPLMRAMTLTALRLFIGISDTTWLAYRKKSNDFLGVIKEVESIIYSQKFEGASAGLLNPNIIARDLGLADKSEHDHKSSDKSMSPSSVSSDLVKALADKLVD